MTKRKHQNEKDGRYTDADGYKNHSGVIPGGKLPPAHHPQSVQSRWDDLPTGRGSSSEIAIMNEAIKQRWPIHESIKARAVEKASEMLESNSERTVSQGVRLLVSMEGQNQDDTIKRTTFHRQVEEVISLSSSGESAPDPAYLKWQREQLLETQEEMSPLGTYVRRLKNKNANGDG